MNLYNTDFHEWIEANNRFEAWIKSRYYPNAIIVSRNKNPCTMYHA